MLRLRLGVRLQVAARGAPEREHREHLPLVSRYLAEGNPPDQPGRLVAWLYEREPVYAFRFPGLWFDIGNPEQLLEADNHWRGRAGLPTRATYSVS